MAHKFILKNKCVICNYYFTETQNFEKKTAKLINLRAYHSNYTEQQLPCGSLTTSSDMFEKNLKEIVSIFDKFFKHFKWKPNVLTKMISVISQKQNFFCHCESHKDEIMKFIVKVLIRFTIKNINNSLKDKNIKNKILKVIPNSKHLNKKMKRTNISSSSKKSYKNLRKKYL